MKLLIAKAWLGLVGVSMLALILWYCVQDVAFALFVGISMTVLATFASVGFLYDRSN